MPSRTVALSCLLAVCLTCLGRNAGLAVADEPATFRWSRTVTFPAVSETTPVAVPLDAAFFKATRDGWPDVRLLDQNAQPLAFLIRPVVTTVTSTQKTFWPAEQTAARVQPEQGLQIEFQLREKDPRPDGIRITTPLRDFEHQIRIEVPGEGDVWQPLGEPTLLFDYSRYVDARNVIVSFDAGPYRKFRCSIADITAEQESQLLELQRRLHGTEEQERIERTVVNRRPFRVDRIEFYRNVEVVKTREAQTRDYPVADLRTTIDDKQGTSVVTFTSDRAPVSSVSLLTGSENFSRPVTVEAKTQANDGREDWRKLTAGNWTQFAVGSIQRQDLSLKFPEIRTREFRVTLENKDSPPLSIDGISAQGPVYELLFLAAPDQKLTLVYGSDDARSGQYDTAALQAVLNQQVQTQAGELGPETQDSRVIAGAVQPWRPWNDPKTLVMLILLLTGVLGWFLYVAGNKMNAGASDQH